MFYFGVILVIAAIVFIGIFSGKKTNQNKFSGGKSASAGLVAGALVGTLVGGSSTIGTAQLAYSYGFSAWWFTLGGAIGVLLLGFVFLKPIYFKEGIKTLPDVIVSEYGKTNGILVAVLSSIGTFLSFVAQIISGSALLMAVFGLSFQICILIVSSLIILYVFFGGIMALGMAGLAKTIILGLAVLACGICSIVFGGGFRFFADPAMFPTNIYFNLFARGFTVDAGAGLSLLVGVITTQSYISAVLSAKSYSDAKWGAIFTAIIVPIMGVASIFVGMYMKANFSGIDTKLALPLFIIEKMPPMISGIMIAALLVAVIGTGSGLAMGMSTMLYKNIIKMLNPNVNDNKSILITRIMLIFITALGGLLCYIKLDNLILSWSFLSMGLRGAVAFMPLITALFLPKKIPPFYVGLSMVGSVIATICGKFILPSSIDPLFLGLGLSLLVLTIGFFVRLFKQNSSKIIK